jgi:hypothetical protein
MASGSAEKKRKRRQSSRALAQSHPASRKARSPKSTPLNAKREETRKQEMQRKPRGRSEPARRNRTPPLSNGFDVLGLITRRTSAVLELPTRLSRCHSPIEFWSEQGRFMQEVFSDCQSVALRIMTTALPMTRSTGRS